MGKSKQPKWFGLELDKDSNRNILLRSLKRRRDCVSTPYWNSDFVNWLIYECTIHHCGVSVESIDNEVVTLCAHCAGVQTQGICLDAIFKVPTADFTMADFVKMIGPYRYHKHGPACRFEWFPRLNDPRIGDKNIVELRWWYDGFYDDSEDEDE